MRRWAWLIGLLTLIAGLVAAYLLLPPKPAVQLPANAQVLPVAEDGIGADFALLQGAKTVRRSDFLGQVVVIYFGYASCPDVCPTTLGRISMALQSLPADEMDQVQPILISVDPERDQAENLMAYARHFHPRFIGLTDTTQDKVRKVSAKYKTFFANFEVKSSMEYVIHHTSRVYVINKAHQQVIMLPHDMTPTDLADSIRWSLME